MMKKVVLAAVMLVVSLFARDLSGSEIVVAAQQDGYYTSLAKHIVRWLDEGGVSSKLVTKNNLHLGLKSGKLAFLVGYDTPSAAELNQIKSFVARGGKIVVFYSSSPALANLMGVKILGYKKSPYPGAWSKMNFNTSFPEGVPKSILQTSTVLMSATGIKGKSSVIATWMDRNGKNTTEACFISSANGYWMTHVLLADGDEKLKSRLLCAMVGSIIPKAWSYKRYQQKEVDELLRVKSYALKQASRRGEIRAVWDHSGCGLYPGSWERTMKILAESKVTDIFVNVAGAGFAHYPSRVLPESKTYSEEGDQMAMCVRAAKKYGIRVHAWILCFTATRAAPGVVADFKNRGWCLKTRDGRVSEYLDPSNRAVRERILNAVCELQSNYAIDGIHLDFVRWYEQSIKPSNAAEIISRFVVDCRSRIKRPRWFTVAVLGKYPSCVNAVGQDWVGWLNSNIVDYIVPMNYSDNLKVYESLVAFQGSSQNFARKTISGIGVTANESRLDAQQVIDQINIARKYYLAGVSLFDLDTRLEKDILPYLKLGIWR
jgi:uncharacterized lipoprotein YddW (UPF0748 family)